MDVEYKSGSGGKKGFAQLFIEFPYAREVFN
jgi:hypothetical protein